MDSIYGNAFARHRTMIRNKSRRRLILSPRCAHTPRASIGIAPKVDEVRRSTASKAFLDSLRDIVDSSSSADSCSLITECFPSPEEVPGSHYTVPALTAEPRVITWRTLAVKAVEIDRLIAADTKAARVKNLPGPQRVNVKPVGIDKTRSQLELLQVKLEKQKLAVSRTGINHALTAKSGDTTVFDPFKRSKRREDLGHCTCRRQVHDRTFPTRIDEKSFPKGKEKGLRSRQEGSKD